MQWKLLKIFFRIKLINKMKNKKTSQRYRQIRFPGKSFYFFIR